MKLPITLSIIIGFLVFLSFGCAHMSDPCDDKLLTQVSSPDGNLVIATYHRECPSKIYTYANVEKPAGFLRSRGERECRIMHWAGRHPVQAVWKDKDNILISTTDRLEKFDFQESYHACGFIKIAYDVQFRNERQKLDDPTVIPKINKVLADNGQCVNAYYKAANPNNDPVAYIKELINKGEHRSAVENILGYIYSASCPVTPATYDLLKELSDTFDLEPIYLERITSRIKQ
jgi:hypothetical protein